LNLAETMIRIQTIHRQCSIWAEGGGGGRSRKRRREKWGETTYACGKHQVLADDDCSIRDGEGETSIPMGWVDGQAGERSWKQVGNDRGCAFCFVFWFLTGLIFLFFESAEFHGLLPIQRNTRQN
jgi:hypothetical protein